MHSLLLVTLVSMAAAGPALAQRDVDATIDRAVAAWAKVRTLRATFEQTIVNPITGAQLTAKGELQQRKPNRLAITFTDPAGDRVVADGKYVWLYLPSATPGQVIRSDMGAAGAGSTDLIGQFLESPRQKYDISDGGVDKVGNRPARVLLLVGKQGQSLPVIRAKVWVDAADGLVRQFEATESNGVSRRVRLLTITRNATVDSSAFVFSLPKGVRIVER